MARALTCMLTRMPSPLLPETIAVTTTRVSLATKFRTHLSFLLSCDCEVAWRSNFRACAQARKNTILQTYCSNDRGIAMMGVEQAEDLVGVGVGCRCKEGREKGKREDSVTWTFWRFGAAVCNWGRFESSCPDLRAGVASNRTPLSHQAGLAFPPALSNSPTRP